MREIGANSPAGFTRHVPNWGERAEKGKSTHIRAHPRTNSRFNSGVFDICIFQACSIWDRYDAAQPFQTIKKPFAHHTCWTQTSMYWAEQQQAYDKWRVRSWVLTLPEGEVHILETIQVTYSKSGGNDTSTEIAISAQQTHALSSLFSVLTRATVTEFLQNLRAWIRGLRIHGHEGRKAHRMFSHLVSSTIH
ncbi:hypothetical protein J7T55_010946 [Diaporthe amygdali]|uniref:uncharacterized protein n=1 Tax=Phomopsis amygdali TaxID=1214568 RepID=UPI0022FE1F9B|nr:uncharacterized protein J7T55_010946 [Diaporthe amygdali]KAJ0100675.1 hypothetical protein J7T55_010946 [Diaporthe amygdali]